MKIVQPGIPGSGIFQTLPARGKLLQGIPSNVSTTLKGRIDHACPAQALRVCPDYSIDLARRRNMRRTDASSRKARASRFRHPQSFESVRDHAAVLPSLRTIIRMEASNI
jgi:hypothetical protein